MTAETSNAREPDVAMALHWIDRYAAGIDDECQIDLVADALGVTLPDGYAAAPPPADARGDVRGLVALAEQMERDAAGCRRDGYIDAAVVKEDCAQRIRQTLGISAIAEAIAAEGVQAEPKAEARGVVDEGSRIVTSQLLHWGGIPVRVTGTVTTSPGNWPLIDAAPTGECNG